MELNLIEKIMADEMKLYTKPSTGSVSMNRADLSKNIIQSSTT